MISKFTLNNFLPAPWVQAEQIHGAKIAVVDATNVGRTIPGVDGLITKQKNLNLIIRTADCLPLSLYHSHTIGLIHAGWKGINHQIHLQAISLFNCPPQEILVALGPSVCKQCYHRHFDLAGTVTQDLLDAGILRSNIDQSLICTCEDARFPSHQRSFTTGEPEGRIINYVSL